MKGDLLISTPAKRYARALLDASIKQRIFSIVLEDLESIENQLSEIPLLRQLFLNPAIPQDKKKGILQSIATKAGFQPLSVNFLNVLMKRHRLNLLSQVLASAEQQFLERQGILVVEVISARKLAKEEESKLTEKLESFTGKKVQLENRIDASLIGGAVTRIGSTLYDGSVDAHLQQLKQKIIE